MHSLTLHCILGSKIVFYIFKSLRFLSKRRFPIIGSPNRRNLNRGICHTPIFDPKITHHLHTNHQSRSFNLDLYLQCCAQFICKGIIEHPCFSLVYIVLLTKIPKILPCALVCLCFVGTKSKYPSKEHFSTFSLCKSICIRCKSIYTTVSAPDLLLPSVQIDLHKTAIDLHNCFCPRFCLFSAM